MQARILGPLFVWDLSIKTDNKYIRSEPKQVITNFEFERI